MLESVADRLIRTLKVKHVAMFLADEDGRFHLQHDARHARSRHLSRTPSI